MAAADWLLAVPTLAWRRLRLTEVRLLREASVRPETHRSADRQLHAERPHPVLIKTSRHSIKYHFNVRTVIIYLTCTDLAVLLALDAT